MHTYDHIEQAAAAAIDALDGLDPRLGLDQILLLPTAANLDGTGRRWHFEMKVGFTVTPGDVFHKYAGVQPIRTHDRQEIIRSAMAAAVREHGGKAEEPTS